MKKLIASALAATLLCGTAAYAAPNAPQQGHQQSGQAAQQAYIKGHKMPSGAATVGDYKKYDLPAPGKGYHYVKKDGHFYKVSTDGVIAAVLGALTAH